MPYQIDGLFDNKKEFDGQWVICRPIGGNFFERIVDAWLVLIGRADAVTFYKQP